MAHAVEWLDVCVHVSPLLYQSVLVAANNRVHFEGEHVQLVTVEQQLND